MNGVVSSELEAIVGLLIAVSIASERLVEIVKGFWPWLNAVHPDPKKEGHRKALLQCLAVVAGILTAFLAQPILAESLSGIKENYLATLSIGLLASGGAGFWNAILSYLLQVKDLKKQEVNSLKNAMTNPAGTFENLNLGEEQVSSNECYNVEDK